jgi:hypothetical protein
LNVRAAASRAVKGSPRSHAIHKEAIIEVCRYSSVNTELEAIQGDTNTAGTR